MVKKKDARIAGCVWQKYLDTAQEQLRLYAWAAEVSREDFGAW